LGSFQINFKRCCGWWSWWWLLTREWQLDPIVADRITTFLKQNPRFSQLPKATPKPSLDVFQQLISSSAKQSRSRPASAVARSAPQTALILQSMLLRLKACEARYLRYYRGIFRFASGPGTHGIRGGIATQTPSSR
jgi:hypothetical protein